jgi:hypothetical protein
MKRLITASVCLALLLATTAGASAEGKPLTETKKGHVDDAYYIDIIEADRIYILTAADFYDLSTVHVLVNIRGLALGLQKITQTYRIVSTVPLQSLYSSSSPTSALIVYVEKK